MPPLLLKAQIFLDNKNCLCQSYKNKRIEDGFLIPAITVPKVNHGSSFH